jgi:hypothetical protein
MFGQREPIALTPRHSEVVHYHSTQQRKALQPNNKKESKNYEPSGDTPTRRLSFSAPGKIPNHEFNTSLGTVGWINRCIYQTASIISSP